MKRKPVDTAIEIEASSGDVYADLGFAEAEEMLAKARLVAQIQRILTARKLTQAAAADVLGIDQPKISMLLRGHFQGYSQARLIGFLTKLGRDIEIVIKDAPRRAPSPKYPEVKKNDAGEKMRYFNLNIKHEHYTNETQTAAEYWLDGKNSAPVFFGKTSVDDLIGGQKGEEAEKFAGIGRLKKGEQEKLIFVTIDSGKIWLFKPAGKIRELKAIEFERRKVGRVTRVTDIPKVIPVELIGEARKLGEIPLVLASMKTNQAFSRGTFREIDKNEYPGNIAAIDFLLNKDFEVDPLDCLSSVEFETLVAKIFEANRCFVPAYKGGFIKDVDLFIYGGRKSDFLELNVDKSGIHKGLDYRAEIQLKLRVTKKDGLSEWLEPSGRNLISLEKKPLEALEDLHEERYFTRKWVRESIRRLPEVNKWLQQSLWWLPKEMREL